jgi:intracellular multiplication protein IcmT
MANDVETLGDYHWRNAMRNVRFFSLDARSAIFLFFFLLHMRLWTLVLVIVAMSAFYLLERMGLDFSSAFRAFRCWLFGRIRPALLWTKRNKMKDYGR